MRTQAYFPGFKSGKHGYVPIPEEIAEPRASGAKFLSADLSWDPPFIPALWPGNLFNTLGPHFFIYKMGLIMPNYLKRVVRIKTANACRVLRYVWT